MEGKALKLAWLVVAIWILGIATLMFAYRSSVTTMNQVSELSNSIDELKYSMFQEPSYRASQTGEQALKLQLIHALRLQMAATYEQNWLTLDMGQLLYTTDQFIEQMKTFLNNELELIALVDQIQTLRAKYQKDSKLSNYYAKVGTNVLAALFSSSESNPKVFRELDQLYVQSDKLPALQKKHLQHMLSKTSSLLGTYAQGNYVIEKIMNNSIYSQIALVEREFHDQQNQLVIGGLVFSGLCLLALFGVSYRVSSVQPIPNQPIGAKQEPTQTDDQRTETPKVEIINQNEAVAMGNDEKGVYEPEIDLKAMLESLGDDYESVCMLLQVFVDDHTGDTEKIAELLHDSPEEALRKAHSLKGVGGNLGAKKLREAAGNVEQALKDGSGSVTELLAELKLRLDKAIDEAQEFLNQQQTGG
ncbi:Hpt domain-containing protein [Vibrio tetraodonis]|uniref:Hpt domain-containing protein n=1 Tax=Vibrio tetraodonis TaxID=2231647 RepID=UPI000E0BAE8D|nr:Hpt domain-containing protein [Vibrio tetraodonis]